MISKLMGVETPVERVSGGEEFEQWLRFEMENGKMEES